MVSDQNRVLNTPISFLNFSLFFHFTKFFDWYNACFIDMFPQQFMFRNLVFFLNCYKIFEISYLTRPIIGKPKKQLVGP
jgi:hypothetical protein